jgi:hypothetical protein
MQIFVQKTPPQTPNVIKPRLIYYNDALSGVGRKLISLIAALERERESGWANKLQARLPAACTRNLRRAFMAGG